MNDPRPTEKKFESHIEEYLLRAGYKSRPSSDYDRSLCLIRDDVIAFIKATQPEEWKKLEADHGPETEDKILSRISSEISKRGVVDVLRNRVVDRGAYFDLCFFEPKSGMNPEHRKWYQSNRFTVVRQLRYSDKSENSLDMVLFLNGIPLVTMELKNQLTGQNIKHSENQYRNDRDPREPLLKFKRCVAHFCVDNDKVSMTTRLAGKGTRFLPYNKDIENPPAETGYRTQYLWTEILTPDSVLDILENFVHISREKELSYSGTARKVETKFKEVLIFPRYHQLELIRRFREQIVRDGAGTNYLVQHTTGSGKSYSIGWLSHVLTSLYRSANDAKRMFDSIVVVTDRNVLDDQLRNIIKSLAKTEGVVSGVDNSRELKRLLEQGKDIIVTTIQKFPFISDTIAPLKDRKFAVIIDEVHSSQSGELSKELKGTLSGLDRDGEYDYEEMLLRQIQNRGRQKHISFFGFTGTPKDKTLELFGTKTAEGRFAAFHIYSMRQSIHEGFTLDVIRNYTTYKRYFKLLKTAEGDVELPTSKGARALVQYVDEHDSTIQNKVDIILNHWIKKGSREIKGRARGMIVTRSRKHCVLYFKEVNRQLEERGIPYRALVGFSGEISVGREKFTEAGLNRTIGEVENIPHALKDPKFRLLIAANKFQTGFDEPLVQSMYVDKQLEGVQCVQTLSRLNRTAPGKTETFVLDFVNSPDDIRDSFQRFYQSTIMEGATDPNRLYDLKREIEGFNLYTDKDVERFCRAFYNPKRDEGDLHAMLDPVVDKFGTIGDEEVREDCRSKIQHYIRMYGYLSQVITFKDIRLEEAFVFLKYLNKKLPKRSGGGVDVSDLVDLDSLRIQKIHESAGRLDPEDGVVYPPDFEETTVTDPEHDLLSEIIRQVNQTHGDLLTEDDKLNLFRLNKRLEDSAEISKYMSGDSSEENKKTFFRGECETGLTDLVSDGLDFYKKLEDHPEVKDMIFERLYAIHRESKSAGQGESSRDPTS